VRPAPAALPAPLGVLAFCAAEPRVSVTAPTAPLALLPLAELDALDLVARERFVVAVARVGGRDLAGDDAFDDRDLADGDDRLAAVAPLPPPAPRLLACVG